MPAKTAVAIAAPRPMAALVSRHDRIEVTTNSTKDSTVATCSVPGQIICISEGGIITQMKMADAQLLATT